jgi:hypothetical protein
MIEEKIINSIGLVCDIVGAWIIAYEIYCQFTDNKFGRPRYQNSEDNQRYPPPESNKYKIWEVNKIKKMKTGLIILTIGFVLQIASNWVDYFSESINNEIPKTITDTKSPIRKTEIYPLDSKKYVNGIIDPNTMNPNPDK